MPGEGLVTEVHNQFVVVRMGGEERESTIAGRLRRSRPVVGDRVEVRELPDRSVRVEAVRPRRGILLRGAFRNEEKIVASNVDVLVIVAAVTDPPLRSGLIDRYLVAAWRGGIEPVLALTKIDLRYDEGEVARVREIYEALGRRVIGLSLRSGEGIDELRGALADRVAVLAGHSGVGKTSLTNVLTGRADATGEVNPVSDRGRHTTTGARYMELPGGGALIDTAGIRSFGIAGVAASELEQAFPEIAAAAEDCEWEGCLHREGEEGCAVPAAVSVAPERLASYRKLLGELEELEAERAGP
ncbi:MAG: ribosome biosis GTPase / thiamine phosphate phosphatase [Gaiellales bacterium]|nr:ribosome biosis GTPase / thiamine phosphate phosphatase [Gaiellales bacterium]MDX6620693.1 ribosome biosis GTPase / thiamine phosphate phosphatase [Gaiellales bacterium]